MVGNNYLENQKEKTKREFTLQVLTSQLICIHWVNISKKAAATSFETVVKVEKPRKSITIPTQEADLDGLGYLQGKEVDFVNTKAFEGTLLAHTDGDVPNLLVKIPTMDAYTLGYTMYFFEIAVGISGYLNGVNPFDQPGVEAYKKNMFALLGKPGFEDLAKELNERL